MPKEPAHGIHKPYKDFGKPYKVFFHFWVFLLWYFRQWGPRPYKARYRVRDCIGKPCYGSDPRMQLKLLLLKTACRVDIKQEVEKGSTESSLMYPPSSNLKSEVMGRKSYNSRLMTMATCRGAYLKDVFSKIWSWHCLWYKCIILIGQMQRGFWICDD